MYLLLQTQNVGNNGSADSRRPSENNSGQGVKSHTPSERNVRRTNYSRNTLPGNMSVLRVKSVMSRLTSCLEC